MGTAPMKYKKTSWASEQKKKQWVTPLISKVHFVAPMILVSLATLLSFGWVFGVQPDLLEKTSQSQRGNDSPSFPDFWVRSLWTANYI